MSYLLAHFVSFLASVSLTVMLAKYLSVSEFGRYGVWLSVLNFLLPIATLSMSPYIIRNIKNGSFSTYGFLKTVSVLFFLGLLAAGAIFLMIFICMPQLGGSYVSGMVFYWALASSAVLVLAAAFGRALDKPLFYLLNVGGQKTISLILLLLIMCLATTPMVEHYFMASAASSSIVVAGIGFVSYFHIFSDQNARTKIRDGLRFCVPVVVANSLVLALPLIERAVLFGWAEPGDLGRYVFNFEMVAKFLSVILLVMKVVVFPSVIGGNKENEIVRYRWYFRNLLFLLALALCLAQVFVYFAYDWVLSVSGMSEYADRKIFMFATFYSVMLILGYMLNVGVMVTGKTKFMSYGAALMLMCHVAGLYIMVPVFGVYGAAMSLVMSQAIHLLVLYFFSEKEIRKYV